MSKIALIGCGGRSELAVNFHRPDLGAELVCAADPAAAAGERFAKRMINEKNQKINLYADYREMIEKEHPDAVLVLSPDYQHKEQSN